MHFLHFVNLANVPSACKRRIPGRRKVGIASLEGVGGLAAHSRLPCSESYRAMRGEGDNEGYGPVAGPFAITARAEREGRRVEANGDPALMTVSLSGASTGLGL